ncbi:MAG TPA: UvrD-helicase domain-containing protein [Aeromicrobium sp.]|nr:UvrD-helicase domain-containing protein [Aeromicrobium sp.]
MKNEPLASFDITDPLPAGTTLLEASAGTGKTWTIGALVSRYLAEAVVTIDELLVITFGRAATREMRERIREQLVSAESALADPQECRTGDNPLLRHLANVDDDEARLRRKRLQVAISDFDAGTIATTHQFCQQVLRSLGTAGDSDIDAQFVEDLAELTDQVVDDLYVAKYANQASPEISLAQAREIAHAVVGDSNSHLGDPAAEVDPTAAVRLRFAAAVRENLDRRKRALGLLSFDDLLRRVESVLLPGGSVAADLMRARFKVVLVDEFQDTDPVQWNVLDRAFSGHSTMVLIGDPKQAIYAFRGGDVNTYLMAAATADTKRTLPTNWRADSALVDALAATFAGAELGHEQITVRPVTAHHKERRLSNVPQPAPFRLRVLQRPAQADPVKALTIPTVRARIAEDLADEVLELLASQARVKTDNGERDLCAGDLAVLVGSGSDAETVRAVFARRNIAAVVSSGQNVLHSQAAADWLALLEAMDSPHRPAIIRALALTDFFGKTATEVATEPDAVTDQISSSVRELTEVFSHDGIAAVLEAVLDSAATKRVLSRPDGNRQMTDLRHVGELMHEQVLTNRLSVTGLLGWLRRERAAQNTSAEVTRRLDSDELAVQIMTIHASKGLEFPIVYLPFLFNRWSPSPKLPRFHDDLGQRFLDVAGQTSADFKGHVARANAEDAGEVLRLAYVAMTRAKSQLVAWWAPTRDASNSGLHRMLFRPDPKSSRIDQTSAVLPDAQALAHLTQWQAGGGPQVELISERTVTAKIKQAEKPTLNLREFGREIDSSWRRTSYSGLTRNDEPHAVGDSEASAAGTTDEPESATLTAVSDQAELSSLPSPMADLPGGTRFGSLIHGVLEDVDVHAPDLHAELRARISDQLTKWPLELDHETAATALEAVLATRLGPLADDLDLKTLLGSRQLRELDFEFGLGGGNSPWPQQLTLRDVADLLTEHLSNADPIRPFADRIRSSSISEQTLRGYLSGSIDLVLRTPSNRFLIADHKTNWLGGFDEPLTIANYHPAELTKAMNAGTYPLQALLYSVVLHRFCRWRVANYDPEVHLGGVLYLYVRGMIGADAPTVDQVAYGVFSWRPPASLIVALSDLLDGGAK